MSWKFMTPNEFPKMPLPFPAFTEKKKARTYMDMVVIKIQSEVHKCPINGQKCGAALSNEFLFFKKKEKQKKGDINIIIPPFPIADP